MMLDKAYYNTDEESQESDKIWHFHINSGSQNALKAMI